MEGALVLLFAAFYPVLTGIPASEFYTTYFLRWIPPRALLARHIALEDS
jgi:hypothetical protein